MLAAGSLDGIVSSDAKVGVVGLGNILMRDEGVGVRMVEAVQERMRDGRVLFYDGGTAILELMPELSRHEVLLIVDALESGGKPGSVYLLERSDLEELGRERPPRTSLHQVSLLEGLRMSELEGARPARVRIMGIEPERIEPGMELSGTLRDRFDELVGLLEREVVRLLDED